MSLILHKQINSNCNHGQQILIQIELRVQLFVASLSEFFSVNHKLQ